MWTALRLDRDRHSAGRAILHRRWPRFRALQVVDSLNHKKDAERHDQEINRRGNEATVGEYWPRLFCVSQRQAWSNLIRQPNVKVAEVEVTHDPADGRHQKVFDDRGNNFSKGCADDHAHREIDRVTFDCKFLKFFPHNPYV